MKFSLSFLPALLTITLGVSQRSAPDQIETSTGTLSIQPILHATMAMTWNGITIYVDPYGGAKSFVGMPSPDLILITDIHGDHMNIETLNAIETANTVIVAPQAVMDKLPDNLKVKVVVLNNNDNINQHGISIKAVPMYNLPESIESRHPKGRGNGYVLRIGNKAVYISGDTSDIPEMRSLNNIDVAFVCMNLPFTMDINQAASAVLEFKPKVVYAFHYRGQSGLSDVEGFKKLVEAEDSRIEVRLRNWYPKD